MMDPQSILRMRECGRVSPKNRFRSVLNVRCIILKKELKDTTLNFDERIDARKAVNMARDAADRAFYTRAPREIIYQLDDTLLDALEKLTAATKKREKRITRLKADLALIQTALAK